jgi:arsenate reductase
MTLETLEGLGYETNGLRSKSWDEFSHAPPLDLIITVCGNAAEETCPIWPGHPMTVHWGVADPAAVSGTPDAVRAFFREIHDQLAGKVEELVRLDPGEMSPEAFRARLEEIGR